MLTSVVKLTTTYFLGNISWPVTS